jgi:hypothetical protein
MKAWCVVDNGTTVKYNGCERSALCGFILGLSIIDEPIYINMPSIEQLIQSNTMHSCYALVYTPKREQSRNRFPENCVFKMESEQAAKMAAEPDKNLYPALIRGPSRSSEGVMLYYLLEWLD